MVYGVKKRHRQMKLGKDLDRKGGEGRGSEDSG